MNNNRFAAFIITHGRLAMALEKVARHLMTCELDLYCYSTEKNSSEQVLDQIEKKMALVRPQRAVFFVDLVGGGCWIIANKIKKDNENFAVIGGVNVPMLVSFLVNFKRLEWPELLQKITQDAKKGIVVR